MRRQMLDSGDPLTGCAAAQGRGEDSERDSDVSHPSLFALGEVKLTERELRALSPQEMLWRHRSIAGLSEALILMIDSDMVNVETTRSFLVDTGYRKFAHADHPDQALVAMRQQLPSLVLLDLSVLGTGGLAALSGMRDDPALRHVPVIVLTGSTDPQVKLDALALGAMDVLAKPVNPSELGLRVRNTLAASVHREYLRQHDALTGLPNREHFRREAEEVLAAAQKDGRRGALLLVGVDALGRVNDAIGRAAGDQLLQRIAKKLISCVQTEAGGELSSEHHEPTLYRFDGDEFAVIVPYMEGAHSAAAFITKLIEDGTVRLQRSGASELLVTCSVGVSVFPTDGMDADLLTRNAGLALRHAKQAGPHRYEFYSQKFNDVARSRLDLGAELHHAVSRDEIELLYEPRVDLATGVVLCAQTALRWNHPSGRVVEGDELLELAGTSEMDVALTEWLFEQMGRHLQNWRAAGLQPVPVGVKVSLTNMRPSDLGQLVNAATSSGMDARQLTLHLQQMAAIDKLPAAEIAGLASLRKKGVRLALDRFGSIACVAHLRKLACDEILLDASFVRDLGKDAVVQAMLPAVADLARRLHLTCVACGVETPAQLSFLKKNGWVQGQGRLFGQPMAGLPFAARWLTRSGKPKRVPMPGENI